MNKRKKARGLLHEHSALVQFVAVPVVFTALGLFITDATNDWRLSSAAYWSVMGLSGKNTTQDYLSASTQAQYQFTKNMCLDGVCLTRADWKCGFVFGSDWGVTTCFERLVRTVSPSTPLEKVRKICGRHNMQFEPAQFRPTEEQCKAEGGTWGVKRTLWADEEELLAKALQ